MFPIVILPSALAAVAELIGTVVVTTFAARAASDLYDVVVKRSSHERAQEPTPGEAL